MCMWHAILMAAGRLLVVKRGYAVFSFGLYSSILQASEQVSFSAGFELLATSQPVAVEDMVSGWNGDYQPGELAFADARSFSQFAISNQSLGQFMIQHEYRRYYYLEFSRDTADFYRAAETTGSISADKHLDLTVKHFEGPGIGVRYDFSKLSFQYVDLSLALAADWYRPGHFQFGEVDGLAKAGPTDQVAANIDYRYDQDKILDSNNGLFAVDDVAKGDGYSFSLHGGLSWSDYQLDWSSKDLFNRFEWSNGAFTQGCVNVGGGVSGVCQSAELQNGFFGNQATIEQINATHSLSFRDMDIGYQVEWLSHGVYDRYSVAKSFITKVGRFDVFLYHPVQLGFGWQYGTFEVHLASDNQDWRKARDLNLNIALGWQW